MCSLGIFGNLVNCISSTNEIAETKLIPRTHTTGTRFSHGTCSPASHTLRREGKGALLQLYLTLPNSNTIVLESKLHSTMAPF